MGKRGCSSMVEHRSSKPITRVRFPSPASPTRGSRFRLIGEDLRTRAPGREERTADCLGGMLSRPTQDFGGTFGCSLAAKAWHPDETARCCSSAVERVLGKDEVLGSSPSSSSWKNNQIPRLWFLILGIWNLVLEI